MSAAALANAFVSARAAVMAAVAAFILAGIVVIAIGENPVRALRIIVAGSLGSLEGLSFTLYYATNFVYTGLAVAVAFRAGLFNIGVEGQATIAGIGIAFAALAMGRLPRGLALPAIIVVGAGFGAAWAFIPAWLQARRGSHIVITTIMFNFLASALLGWLLVEPLRAPGSMQPETRSFEAGALLPKFDDIAAWIGVPTTGSPLNASFLIALLAAVAVYIVISRTRFGFRVRVLGANPAAASYAGISVTQTTVAAMLISGALASGVALNEVVGAQGRLILEFTGGYGFVGIAVALMGRNHPVGIVLAALLFGALYQGGAELAFEMPRITRDMIILVQGLVVLMVGYLVVDKAGAH